MKKIREVIVVEGRYDKNTLSQVVDATVITVGGFSVFNDKEKLAFLRRLAEERGLIILTDSDGAGFVIRNYLKGAIPEGKIYHAYIPDLYGKEKRKAKGTKEGKLGVEGVPDAVIVKAVEQSGALSGDVSATGGITKADLFELGLSGGTGSAQKRQDLLCAMQLPAHLSPNALLDVLNCITDLESLQAVVQKLEA